MAEVEDYKYEDSSNNVLLQELAEDLPEETKSLLDKPELRSQVLQYLSDISLIKSNDYLSSVPPTPAANEISEVIEERTLVHDIAELEASQRSIDSKMKNLISKSQGSIIENEIELKKAFELFEGEFVHNTRALARSFRDDDISDIRDDQELHELEADLDPSTKQDSFSQTIANIQKAQPTESEKNKNLSVVLDNMDQIVVILELPSLAGACIKAGYYSEALEISSYTRRLAIRFPQSDLIKEVELGVKSEMSLMLSGLIRLLRTNLKQSSIIKILSYLRRIQPFSQSESADEQLKRILLHSRYQFIEVELESLKPLKQSELHEKYLKRSIEVIREHCFGSIMTYRNIFPDIDDSELEYPPIGEIEEEKEEKEEEELVPVVEPESESNESNEKVEGEEEAKQAENEAKEEESTDATDLEEKKETETETERTEEKDDEEPLKDVKAAEEDKPKESEESKELSVEMKPESEVAEETPKDKATPEPKTVIELTNTGKKSNILLFEFTQQVVLKLLKNIKLSISQIEERSIRDGLYLQLIYCSQSLGRIDENFSDWMTVTLLNSKYDDTENYIIDRKAWANTVEKQQKLAKSLNR